MQLRRPFIRLPFRFDISNIRDELERFAPEDWQRHPEGHEGNTALSLIAVDGDPMNDAVSGTMRATPHLSHLRNVQQILHKLDAPIGRTRFMRIRGNADATAHVDTNYYWYKRMRIHIPIVTTPEVTFICGDATTHMAEGECWIFDTWRRHNVINSAQSDRIHLVIDTVGSPALWSIIDRTLDTPAAPSLDVALNELPTSFVIEPPAFPAVMSATDMRATADWIIDQIDHQRSTTNAVEKFTAVTTTFIADWTTVYDQFGDRVEGDTRYERLRRVFDQEISTLAKTVTLTNGIDGSECVRQLLVRPARNRASTVAAPSARPRQSSDAAAEPSDRMRRPVIIVSPPRAGSTLLIETLSRSRDGFTIGGECHTVIGAIPSLEPSARNYHSNQLIAADATPEVIAELRHSFWTSLRDRDGNAPTADGDVVVLEKTPKNALRIPFLQQVFPDARFVYLYRDPRQQLASMLAAWRSGRFVTYPNLPDWTGLDWSLLLVPEWRDLIDEPLPRVVAQQWARTTTQLLNSLEQVAPDKWCVANYDHLLADPRSEIERICKFVNIAWDDSLADGLPLAQHTLTAPAPDKWKQSWPEIAPYVDEIHDVIQRAEDVFGHDMNTKQFATAKVAPDAAFSSVSTNSFSQLLTAAKSSVLVSTYQSNRLITVREQAGGINTNFVAQPRPMGIALGADGRLAVGTKNEVLRFRNQPAAAAKIVSEHPRDAAFIARGSHVTGDIAIHDMAYTAENELWIVNTRFSALCTLDEDHSFTPRWRPNFVSAYAAEDRCHLNGLALVGGQPRYVTCLARTDYAGGWRKHKEDGGVIVDITTDEIIVEGLSMPHSPRWHDGSLWVLESGKGSLARVNVATGAVETIAELPGFTRGLAFLGVYALVGLSQVRESLFGGLPLTRRPGERFCGVWVVDTRDGQTVGFLRFEGAVQEIFDVQVATGLQSPEILDQSADAAANSFVVPNQLVPQFA